MDPRLTPDNPNFLPPCWLADEVAERLSDRLDWLKITPRRILWLGAAEQRAAALTKRYRGATLTAFPANGRTAGTKRSLISRWYDRLGHRTREGGSSAASFALAELAGSAELLLANLLLYHAQEPKALLAAWQELLAPHAPLFFTTFGPDTLKEVRALAGDSPWPHLPDMHDLGDLLVQLRYAEPVMDMHYLTISYQTPQGFWADWGPWLAPDAKQHAATLRQVTFPLAITVELVFGHAWRAVPSPDRPNASTPQPIHWHRR
jgi:malonyl-CoA O-methyltransferase